MTSAYLDCFSGISGDMFVGALLDAGVPLEELRSALSLLPVEGYRLEAERTHRKRIFGTRFKVIQDQSIHLHRTFSDIRNIIEKSGLSDAVKQKSLAVFEELAIVEGAIHGLPPEKVHFHEVGAVDSIIDIVGVAFCLEYMNIRVLCCSALPLGHGFTESSHGTIPLPAPATAVLLKGVPVYGAGIPFEFVTPTGAALVKRLCSSFGIMPPMIVERIGHGAGSMELADRPNLLRIFIGGEVSSPLSDTAAVLETDIDDASPEWLGFAMERLFAAGALDVAFMPAQMKKNRPGVHMQVIGPPHLTDALADVIFRETGTLGIRTSYCLRRILSRREVEINGPFGSVKAKEATGLDGRTAIIPEYEECRRIAAQRGIPLKEVYAWVMSLCTEREK
jgi:uncharacterized protein (TIGR00299 family) protein